MFSKKHFAKKIKKNALDVIRILSTDDSITFDIVPQKLQFRLDFSRGVTPFGKNKGSQKLDPSWTFFCYEPSKCSGPNKLLNENIDLEKLNLKHAKITVIKNIFDKKNSLPLIVNS